MDAERAELRRTHENAKGCVEAMTDTLFGISEMLGKQHYISAELQMSQFLKDYEELAGHLVVLTKWEGEQCLSNR